MSNEKVRKVMHSSGNNEWGTPEKIYNPLNEIYKFTLDPCCTPETAKCSKFFTAEDNGLEQSWANERVFMNPPYSRDLLKHFIKKAYEESEFNNALVVALIPSRTDTEYFHKYITKAKEIIFVKGRIKFLSNGVEQQAAPFPSMIVVWNKTPLINYNAK